MVVLGLLASQCLLEAAQGRPAAAPPGPDLGAGVFILNDKVDSAGKPLKKTKVAEMPTNITCPGKFKFEGAGTLELVPTGWHDEKAGGNSQAVEVDKDGKHIIKMDGRAYFAETCTAGNYNNEQYQALNLLGKTMRYTTDFSGAGCGCNAAMYLVSMRQNTRPSECYDYYCDANNVCGESCHEIDIQEGNIYSWHSTLHTKSDAGGFGKGYGGGDGWDGPRDFEGSEYGPQGSCIDTSKPFQVAVSFPVDEDRKLQAMVVVLSQTGHDCQLTMNLDEYEGMGELSGALEAGMTPVVSYWNSPDMLWMDGKGDDGKGPCAVDDVKACPAQVKFYDWVLEDIAPEEPEKEVPAPAEEPEKESSQEPAPEEADRPEEKTEEAPTPEPVQQDEAQPQEEHPDDEAHEDPCSATRTEDCRNTQCCQDAGMQCFEKDEYWATCQISCEKGSIDRLDKLTSAQGYDHPASPWSCSPLGKRTPGKADPRIVDKADASRYPELADALGEDAKDAKDAEVGGSVVYQAFANKNAYAPWGAIDIDEEGVDVMDANDCQDLCSSDHTCDCASFYASKLKCWKRRECVVSKMTSPFNDGYTVFVKYADAEAKARADADAKVGSSVVYQTFDNKNAFAPYGAIDIDKGPEGVDVMDASDCQDRCTLDHTCDCATFYESKLKCWKRRECVVSKMTSPFNDGYTVFVKSFEKKKNKKKVEGSNEWDEQAAAVEEVLMMKHEVIPGQLRGTADSDGPSTAPYIAAAFFAGVAISAAVAVPLQRRRTPAQTAAGEAGSDSSPWRQLQPEPPASSSLSRAFGSFGSRGHLGDLDASATSPTPMLQQPPSTQNLLVWGSLETQAA
jgi:hypothetical protein